MRVPSRRPTRGTQQAKRGMLPLRRRSLLATRPATRARTESSHEANASAQHKERVMRSHADARIQPPTPRARKDGAGPSVEARESATERGAECCT